jgi:hypothetical protein
MIALGNESGQPKPPFTGAGWRAGFAAQRKRPPSVYRGKEIVLYANTWQSAQRALDLIRGCHQLLRGDPDVFPVQLVAHNDNEPEAMEPEERAAQEMWSTTNIPLACLLAAKASRRARWVYAVTKYRFSLSLYSVHHVDLEPWRAPHLPTSSFPGDHVMFCHAIISAFSAIEQMEFDLKASGARPSRRNGEWNPVIKQDLEKRLKRGGISIQEPILWTVRGPQRRIEKRRNLPQGSRAPWSAKIVRDSEIPIIDAIAYAEWLRDKVASHAANHLTAALSPYDVINVQHVTRRLLLETLGFWCWYEAARPTPPSSVIETDSESSVAD